MIERVDSIIFNGYIPPFGPLQSEASQILPSTVSLSSLHGKKSFANPIKAILNWFTSILKAFWGFVCRICCCKKASVVETKIEKEVPRDKILAQIRNSIIAQLPADFHKIVLNIRYGNESHTAIFTEKQKLLDDVKKWLDLQKTSNYSDLIVYAFKDQKQEEKQLRHLYLVNAFIQKNDPQNSINVTRKITFENHRELTTYIKDPRHEDDQYLLEIIIPRLNKQYFSNGSTKEAETEKTISSKKEDISLVKKKITGEESKLLGETNKVYKDLIINQLRDTIFNFPNSFDKAIIYLRHWKQNEKQSFQKVFVEKEGIIDKIEPWLDLQSSYDKLDYFFYVFYKKEGVKAPFMYVFADTLEMIKDENGKPCLKGEFCSHHGRRPSFIENIENDEELLSTALPELKEIPIPVRYEYNLLPEVHEKK